MLISYLFILFAYFVLTNCNIVMLFCDDLLFLLKTLHKKVLKLLQILTNCCNFAPER